MATAFESTIFHTGTYNIIELLVHVVAVVNKDTLGLIKYTLTGDSLLTINLLEFHFLFLVAYLVMLRISNNPTLMSLEKPVLWWSTANRMLPGSSELAC